MSLIALLNKLVAGILVVLVANPWCCCGLGVGDDAKAACCSMAVEDGESPSGDPTAPKEPCPCGDCKKEAVGAVVEVKVAPPTEVPESLPNTLPIGEVCETVTHRRSTTRSLSRNRLKRDATIAFCEAYCVYRL